MNDDIMFNRRRNGILIVRVRDVQIRLSALLISGYYYVNIVT